MNQWWSIRSLLSQNRDKEAKIVRNRNLRRSTVKVLEIKTEAEIGTITKTIVINAKGNHGRFIVENGERMTEKMIGEGKAGKLDDLGISMMTGDIRGTHLRRESVIVKEKGLEKEKGKKKKKLRNEIERGKEKGNGKENGKEKKIEKGKDRERKTTKEVVSVMTTVVEGVELINSSQIYFN